MKVFFYPHAYMRDRQIDTILHWSEGHVVNPDIAKNRRGAQVSASKAHATSFGVSWRQRLPLLNIKLRPREVPEDAVVYVWGALIASGDFIVDLDNPWSLVGYNIGAMSFYRLLLRHLLLSRSCLEIRCMSEACKKSLRLIFGEDVHAKASVHYPFVRQAVETVDQVQQRAHFLFVGTQFEIKGGEALLRAFSRVHARFPGCHLDIVTHLPKRFRQLVAACSGIEVHEARFSREEIHTRFMRQADILVLPTYVDSFGMVALEALAHGLGLIATDVYALGELVETGYNGDLLKPPISIWDSFLPSAVYSDLANVKQHIHATDTGAFEDRLTDVIERFVVDPAWRLRARQASTRLMRERFAC
jgi:glycosyltransferase involved in cell wall biosynthesis